MRDPIERQAASDALCDNCDNVQALCPHYPCKQYKAINALPSAQPEIIRCKDCKHYHEDVWGDEIGHDDIPLILAHEMCDFWGGGCKTREDAFCSFAERRTDE